MAHPISRTFHSRDGTCIGYSKFGGDGPAIVIVHQSVATGASWHRVAELLATDFTCYVLNRRGRPGSGDTAPYSIEREYEDIEAALQLASDESGTRADLVAHSFGAVCALGAALLDPPRRLVIYEPPLPYGGTVAGPVLPDYKAAIEAGDRDRALEIAYAQFASVPPAKIQQMRDRPEWREASALAHTWTREVEAVEAHGPSLKRYRSLNIPVLLLLGAQSGPHPFQDTTRGLVQTLPHARLVELAGQGHLANERVPALLANIIRDFLLH